MRPPATSRSRAARMGLHGAKHALDIVLHPLSIYALLTVYALPTEARWVGIALGLVGPVLVGIGLQQTRKVKSFFSATRRHDKLLLLLTGIIFYSALLTFCIRIGMPALVRTIPLSALAALSAALLLLHLPKCEMNGHFVALAVLETHVAVLAIRLNLLLALPAIIALLATGVKAYLWMEMGGMSLRTLARSILLGVAVTLICYWLV